MAYNKVTYKDEILMDITDSTVTPETLSEGVVAYGANGERIVGTAAGGSVSAPLIVHSLVEDNGTFDKSNFKSIAVAVENIGDNAFADDYPKLESVELVGVKRIGHNAFVYCTSLTSINIPDSVTEIGSTAFGVCPKLTGIIIPHSVTSLGACAFNDCWALTEITYEGTISEWKALDNKLETEGCPLTTQETVVHCTDGDTMASVGESGN